MTITSVIKKTISILLTIGLCILHAVILGASLFIKEYEYSNINHIALMTSIVGSIVIVLLAILLQRSRIYLHAPCNAITRIYTLLMLVSFVVISINTGLESTLMFLGRKDFMVVAIVWTVVPILMSVMTFFTKRKKRTSDTTSSINRGD